MHQLLVKDNDSPLGSINMYHALPFICFYSSISHTEQNEFLTCSGLFCTHLLDILFFMCQTHDKLHWNSLLWAHDI